MMTLRKPLCASPLLLLSLLIVSLLRVSITAQAQQAPDYAKRNLNAVRLPEGMKPPSLTGDLSDAVWQKAAVAETFVDTIGGKPAGDQTQVYLLYDKNYLYVAFRCHESVPSAIVSRETVRDANLNNDDTVQIQLDPFLSCKWEDTTAFTVNPLGTRSTRQSGGRAGKLEWQGDWDAVARRSPDGWTAEMHIPWRILSYPRSANRLTMGINFLRLQQRTRVQSQWSDLGPQSYLERQGRWNGVEVPPQAWKPRLSLLPYVIPAGQIGDGGSRLHSGLDARYQPTPELTAVGTINPDFASVEGAVESIGFSRSERFVPDRRPFFLEGRNFFRNGDGFALGLLFDSARIQQVDTGVKFYGKVTPQTTLAVLATAAPGRENNFVANIRREFSPTAGISAILLQRGEPGNDNTAGSVSANKRFGKWSVNSQIAQTAGRDADGLGWTTGINLEDRNFFATVRYRSISEHYQDRLGFLDFNDARGWSGFLNWGTEWRHGWLRNFNFSAFPVLDTHQDGRPFRRQSGVNLDFETRSDYGLGFFVNGGKFDADTDFTWGGHINGGVSNRFRRWGFDFATGEQANEPFTSFGPSVSLRLFKKLDVSLGSFVQSYQGLSQQHILTFNYEISPYRSWGGRMVISDSDTNFYISYRNAGRAGLDTYLIIGDPNARRFTKRVMVKWVFAL